MPPLIGDRLDITGARWGLQGAEAILTLRAVIANGDYDDYWRYHLAREHQSKIAEPHQICTATPTAANRRTPSPAHRLTASRTPTGPQ